MDPANQDQYDAWNGESGLRWVRTADRRDAVLAPVGDLLLDAAAVQPGHSLLDIGCGCGATTLTAARRSGPSGRITGIDFSAPMLDLARSRAAEADAGRIEFMQADAQTVHLDSRYDVAISRFGTMFFSDPIAAFKNIARHLRAEGRLCIVTWQPLATNQWLVVPESALREYDRILEPGSSDSPGMFAQSEPSVIAAILTAAGFARIASEPVITPLNLGAGLDDAVDYLLGVGLVNAALEEIPEHHREPALDALRGAVAPYHDGRGVHLDAAVWLTTATVG